MNFRLITWNCNTVLHTKVDRLLLLRPSIAIIPECAEPDILRREAPQFAFTDCQWSGTNPKKGLGVFTFNGLTLSQHHSFESSFRFFLPLEVRGELEINLLAIWAFDIQGTRATANPTTTPAALGHYTPFLKSRPSIVAGDFNGGVAWDKGDSYRSFAGVDAKLRELGLVSAYHHTTESALGAELHPTFFMHRKRERPYHIDYVYIPRRMVPGIREMTVGSSDEWLYASDHMPLVLDVDVDTASANGRPRGSSTPPRS